VTRRDAAALSLSLLAAAAARADQPGAMGAITVTSAASRPPSPGAATYFVGTARVQPLFPAADRSRVSGGSVTFEPGARTAWHSHPLGQVLIVTAGTGWVQSWGGPRQEIRQGDVVRIPPGVKHWHGAMAGTGMTHIAIQEQAGGRSVDWMEPVSDAQYRP
jgi:quercetin dioxygenase-like cupin family protein